MGPKHDHLKRTRDYLAQSRDSNRRLLDAAEKHVGSSQSLQVRGWIYVVLLVVLFGYVIPFLRGYLSVFFE